MCVAGVRSARGLERVRRVEKCMSEINFLHLFDSETVLMAATSLQDDNRGHMTALPLDHWLPQPRWLRECYMSLGLRGLHTGLPWQLDVWTAGDSWVIQTGGY